MYTNLERAVFLNITIPWIMCAKSARTTEQKKINGNKWSEMETVDASNVSNIC